jgi:hypothetical protein
MSSSSVLGKRAADAHPDAPAPKEAKLVEEIPFREYKWCHKVEGDIVNWHVWDGIVKFQGVLVDRPSFLRCVFRELHADKLYKACNVEPRFLSMDDMLTSCEDILGRKKAKYAEHGLVCIHEFRDSAVYTALRSALVQAPLKYIADHRAATERRRDYERARAAYVTARDLLRQLVQEPVTNDVKQFLSEDERRLCICCVRGHFDKCPCMHMR